MEQENNNDKFENEPNSFNGNENQDKDLNINE